MEQFNASGDLIGDEMEEVKVLDGRSATEFEQAVLDKLERIALAQEANANFQKSLIAIFTPLIPAMLASFGQSFGTNMFAPPLTVPAKVADGK